MQLTRGGEIVRPMRLAVDHHAARAADPLAAIVIERDRLFALCDQLFVEDVEHLEERRMRRDVRDLVGDERALRLAVLLAPDVERQRQRAHL